MAQPLRVEAPNEDMARALMDRLSAFPTELTSASGHFEVTVSLVGSVDRSVVTVLDRVDEWLVENEIGTVRVHLDDRAYTLSAPVAER